MALHAPIRKITPPSSIIQGPPTPPSTDTKLPVRVASILRVFKEYQKGIYPESDWPVYQLSESEYEQALDQLKHDDLLESYVEGILRYDWDPVRGELILRMGSTLHDTFALYVAQEIQKSLEYLANTEIETQPFINGIKHCAGAIFLQVDDGNQVKEVKRIPDIRFRHNDAAWPGIVIEVSHSQKRKSLPYLADNYILGSDGNINVMVGLDLDYRKSKEASISIWRLKTSTNDDGEVEGEVEQVVNNQLFRNAEGHHILSSSGLELSLKDFSVEEVTNSVPDHSIVIDTKTLCTLLGNAENQDDQKTIMMEGAKRSPLKRKKYREPTPPEQLTLSDEEKFVEEERQVRRKLEKIDPSYRPEGIFVENSSQDLV